MIKDMRNRKKAILILEDGSQFEGWSFGAEKEVAGEVVFNTAMTGYPESLTDPSYAGQLMVLTYPLVGNYGVPPFTIMDNGLPVYMESEKIHVEAMIVSDYSEEYSHWNACESLESWLVREGIPGVTGIDTRALTKKIRERGVMMGRVVFEGVDKGQWEACETLGLSSWQTMRFVVLPQAFKLIVPPIISEFVTLIKDSSLTSTIGAIELLKSAQIVGAEYYEVMSPYFLAAIFYLVMTISISYIGKKVEKRLAVSD